MPPSRAGRRRARGTIDTLPSGALRVRVYAGSDPVTGRRHDLIEVIPPGPKAATAAEAARTRLLNQVDERRSPRTGATVDQLLNQHLVMLDLEPNTVQAYRELADNHIRPLLGSQKVAALGGDVFDSFYAELRRCRRRCGGVALVDHRTGQQHECDQRCRPHRCEPLSPATTRKIHFVLSGALKRAVRWRWIAVNPISQAEAPAQPKPNPRPPTPGEAARLLAEAWRDPEWGLIVWLAMVTGLRRGELCGLRWHDVELDHAVVRLERSIGQRSGRIWEKTTKTHQQRRIALDPETVELLREHRDRCRERADAVGVELGAEAFVFSPDVDGASYLKPDTITQRYGRLATGLGIATSIHKLRHYSATELIAAGVDVRTVAGRLGHSGGGSTTLKVYAAWVSESDQRAAGSLFDRMPRRPEALRPGVPPSAAARDAVSPYEVIAARLREHIADGELRAGERLPTIAQIAEREGVAISTAQRAVAVLKAEGLVDAAKGRPARVLAVAASPGDPSTRPVQTSVPQRSTRAVDRWALVLRGPDGRRYRARHVAADLDAADDLRRHLVSVARVEVPELGPDVAEWVGDFELEVHDPDQVDAEPVRVLRW